MNQIKLFIALLMVSLPINNMAQSGYQTKLKQTKKELNEKASKASRKEAKRLKKEGWIVTPGSLSLERQLDRAYMFEMDVDEEMNPVYIIGEGQSIGENYDAAKLQASELARQQIAGKIESETTTIIDNLVGNKQLGAEEAETITTLLSEGKTIFSQKLGRIQPVIECYRVLENKNKEVLVRLATKENSVRGIVKKYLLDELEKKGTQMSDELKEWISTK